MLKLTPFFYLNYKLSLNLTSLKYFYVLFAPACQVLKVTRVNIVLFGKELMLNIFNYIDH